MEVIYPRDNRRDSVQSGTIGEGGGIVGGGVVNEAFYQWLTQYFNEDNRQSIVETINNYYQQMSDVGVNELLFAYMAKFEIELKAIKEAIQNIDLGNQLIENHTVYNLGEYTWNEHTENIYMLTGGVPSTITINQYINNICGVAIFGSEFKTLDAATGLIDISLYPLEYLETLLANNAILTIGGENYVPLTICEITINNGELGDQLGGDTETDGDTSGEFLDDLPEFYYNWWVGSDARKITSSDSWRVPSYAEMQTLAAYLGGTNVAGGKLKETGIDFWNSPNTGATNEVGFNGRGSGGRNETGSFFSIMTDGWYWAVDEYNATQGRKFSLNYANAMFSTGMAPKKSGFSIRLVQSTVSADGTITQYTGNNGQVYQAVAIGGLFWLTEDLREDFFRNGDPVILTESDIAWAALVTPSMCTRDNEAYKTSANGGVTVVDNGGVSILEIDSGNGLNEPKPVSELGKRALSSLLLRKI